MENKNKNKNAIKSVSHSSTDTPSTDTPSTDTSSTDTPSTDTSSTDTPSTDTPSTVKDGVEQAVIDFSAVTEKVAAYQAAIIRTDSDDISSTRTALDNTITAYNGNRKEEYLHSPIISILSSPWYSGIRLIVSDKGIVTVSDCKKALFLQDIINYDCSSIRSELVSLYGQCMEAGKELPSTKELFTLNSLCNDLLYKVFGKYGYTNHINDQTAPDYCVRYIDCKALFLSVFSLQSKREKNVSVSIVTTNRLEKALLACLRGAIQKTNYDLILPKK